MSAPLVLAVDAGNSKTLAVVTDVEGRIRGTGRTGCGDVYAAGEAGAAEAVLGAARSALTDAGGGFGDVVASAFHLAGIDWPEDDAFWAGVLDRELPSTAARVVRNDGFALLRCIDVAGVGASVVVGTGPAVAARGPSGAEAAMSFWCRDAIGGGALGDDALRAVVLADLGLGPATALTDSLPAFFGAPDVATLLHASTRRGGEAGRSARAARLVLACATDGDAVARGIVESQARALAGYVAAIAARAGLGAAAPDAADRGVPRSWTAVLGGSILASEIPVFRDAVVAALAEVAPAARPEVSPVPPVLGALLDALYEWDPGAANAARAPIAATALPADLTTT